MSYNPFTGIRTCDRCNNVISSKNNSAFSIKYDDLCYRCKDEIKMQKEDRNLSGGSVNNSKSNIIYFLVALTALFWGGPYLLIKGYKEYAKYKNSNISVLKRRATIKIILGLFLTVVLIYAVIETNLKK